MVAAAKCRVLPVAFLLALIVQAVVLIVRTSKSCWVVSEIGSEMLQTAFGNTSIPLTIVQSVLTEEATSDEQAVALRPEQIGIDPVFLQLLVEAERRSTEDFATSHQLGERGIVIGPTEGNFERHTVRALRNARRIRHILGEDRSLKLALMTSREHIDILHGCLTDDTPDYCYLYMNGTLFDDIIETKLEYQPNDKHTLLEQGSSKYWLKALGGYRHAPYEKTLFLDSDAYPCPGFDKLYALVDSTIPHKSWQLPVTGDADFAAGIDQYPFGTGDPEYWVPGDPKLLPDYFTFAERNTGTVLFHFQNKVAHDFAHFIPLVSEYVYNHMASDDNPVVNDQCPFKIAMYLFQRLRPDFRHNHIPMHSSCRAYPGDDLAGTDGFENGMFPLLESGERCRDCHCTPCLVTHTAYYRVTMNGQLGWEKDFSWEN